VLFPWRFFATKDFVELFGTSEDFAIGISIFLTTTGVGAVCVGLAVGVGAGLNEEAAAGITFPESQASTVLPFDLVLMQV
jgi:hypothetical protein